MKNAEFNRSAYFQLKKRCVYMDSKTCDFICSDYELCYSNDCINCVINYDCSHCLRNMNDWKTILYKIKRCERDDKEEIQCDA